MDAILTELTVSMSDFKKNPAKVLREAGREPVAVLNRNKTAFYVVEPEVYEAMLEDAWERSITTTVRERLGKVESAVEVDLERL